MKSRAGFNVIHFEISKIVNKILPPEVHFYGTARRDLSLPLSPYKYHVKYTDANLEKVYFETEYEFPISTMGKEMEQILKDAEHFSAIWNSPLMKALR